MGLKRFFRRVEKQINRNIDKATGGKIAKFRKQSSRGLRRNKIVRAVAIAAAVYFTAGAALGAAGSMAAGGGFWSGVGSGLSSAASGLTSGSFLSGAYGSSSAAQAAAVNAGGGAALAAGENVGTILAGSETATGATAAGNASAAALNAAPAASAPAASAPVQQVAANEAGKKAAEKGLMAQAMDWTSTAGGGMLASSALKLAGGAQQDQAEQEAYDRELARRNANQNVGGITFGPVSNYGSQSTQRLGPVDVPQFDPYAQTAPGLMRSRMSIGQ